MSICSESLRIVSNKWLKLNYLNLLGFKEETQTLIDHNRTAEFKEEFLKANGRKANDGDLPSTCHYTNVVNLDASSFANHLDGYPDILTFSSKGSSLSCLTCILS